MLATGVGARASVVWQNDPFANDAAFNAFYAGLGTSYESFGGEGRWGNNNTDTGVYEYNINRRKTDGSFVFGVVTSGKKWVADPAATKTFSYNWTIEYLGDAAKSVNWTVQGSPMISLTANFGGLRSLAIRAAVRDTAANPTTSDLKVSNFVLTEYKPAGNVVTTAPTSILAEAYYTTSADKKIQDYAGVRGFDLSGHWSLSGTTTYTWTGGNPSSQTSFSFQIKAMNPAPSELVPEPGTAALLGMGFAGGAIVLFRRRRSA